MTSSYVDLQMGEDINDVEFWRRLAQTMVGSEVDNALPDLSHYPEPRVVYLNKRARGTTTTTTAAAAANRSNNAVPIETVDIKEEIEESPARSDEQRIRDFGVQTEVAIPPDANAVLVIKKERD
jgi:hypothetical protein